MKLILQYHEEHQEAEFHWSEDGPWNQLRSVLLASTSQFSSTDNSIRIPWYAVLGAWDQLGEFFALNPIVELIPDSYASSELERAFQRRDTARSTFEHGELKIWTKDELQTKLNERGYRRPLKDFQTRNLCKLCPMDAAANFSVPGAGKTTEALAYFVATSKPTDRLLVLSPKNAFSAWQDTIEICMPEGERTLARLVGGESQIRKTLDERHRFMIIAYSQLSRDPIPDLIAECLARDSFYLFLDESHRIKHGTSGKSGQAVLRLSSLPTRKMILSGTPMPQGFEDLVPQFSFLYPEIAFPANEKIIELIRPAFVRTTKAELNLPSALPPRTYDIPMSNGQAALNYLLHEDLRTTVRRYSRKQKSTLRKLRMKVLRLIQLNANPSIVGTWDNEDIDPALLNAILSEPCAKLDYACDLTRDLTDSGEKVLLWSNFRSSIMALRARLHDLGPVHIDGSVDAGNAEDQDTREGRLHRFSTDPSCKVLIANPMAAAEGISLHTICRHAIYVDRTFNAAQYLQSLDRIYRIGMPEGWHPTWHVLAHKGTIDEIVDARLKIKIDRMARVLNDPDLHAMGGEWVELQDDAEITEELILGASTADIEAVVS